MKKKYSIHVTGDFRKHVEKLQELVVTILVFIFGYFLTNFNGCFLPNEVNKDIMKLRSTTPTLTITSIKHPTNRKAEEDKQINHIHN